MDRVELLRTCFGAGEFGTVVEGGAILLHRNPNAQPVLDYVWRALVNGADAAPVVDLLKPPARVEAHYPLCQLAGLLRFWSGDLPEAMRLFMRARQLKRCSDAGLMIGHTLHRAGRDDDALGVFQRCGHDSRLWNELALRPPPAEPARSRIYVAYHKPAPLIANGLYQPLHVGRALATADLGMPGDDTGDHISGRNGDYCELTALYWIWRNVRDLDYVGLCHYRRVPWWGVIPALPQSATQPNNFFSIPQVPYGDLAQGMTLALAAGMAAGADMLLPRKVTLIPMRDQWVRYHDGAIFDLALRVLLRRHPDFAEAAAAALAASAYHLWNMFFMRRELFDGYAAWLFGLLFELEETARRDRPELWQPRMAGFLAERLFNIYLEHLRRRGARALEYPIVLLR